MRMSTEQKIKEALSDGTPEQMADRVLVHVVWNRDKLIHSIKRNGTNNYEDMNRIICEFWGKKVRL